MSLCKVTFLGTSAGEPSLTRNVSSLALQLDSQMWLFDCGEATQHQLMKSTLKQSSITKIFITHMHADHTLGLVPLITSLCKENVSGKVVDIYGPSGTRELIRTTLRLVKSHIQAPYRVHELLFPDESICPSSDSDRYENEASGGSDIYLDKDTNSWKVFNEEEFQVNASPITHTIRCIGYVVSQRPRLENLDISTLKPILMKNAKELAEKGIKNPMVLLGKLQREQAKITLPDGYVLEPPRRTGPGRKLVILGDTSDASGIQNLAQDADLLIHECTNAYLPGLDAKPEHTEESVRLTAKERGHSTPEVAGEFAKRIGAKRLCLNHLSSRYIDPLANTFDHHKQGSNITTITTNSIRPRSAVPVQLFDDQNDVQYRLRLLQAIKERADKAWGKPDTILARDFLTITL